MPRPLGYAVSFLVACAYALMVGCDVAPPGPPIGARPDTIVVFAVWGSSNACGRGDQALSPEPEPGTAFQRRWTGGAETAPLTDPFPCYRGRANDGSAWPQFAVTHHEATDRLAYLTSVARGASRILPHPDHPDIPSWHPDLEGELYDDGRAAIGRAVEAARFELPARPIVAFGGVVWIQGNDINDVFNGLITMEDYLNGLRDLLEAFERDIVQDPDLGGKFYFVNTLAKPHLSREVIEEYTAQEASVCAEYDHCVLAAPVALTIYDNYHACTTDACRGLWYRDSNHWGQEGLNLVGMRAAQAAAGAQL